MRNKAETPSGASAGDSLPTLMMAGETKGLIMKRTKAEWARILEAENDMEQQIEDLKAEVEMYKEEIERLEAKLAERDEKIEALEDDTLDYLGTAVARYEIGAGSARVRYLTSNAETGDVVGDYVSLALGAKADTDGDITGALASLIAPDRDAFGKMAGGASELVAAGAATDLSKAAGHGIHRFAVSGDATGAATAENVFTFDGLSATQFAANTATATDGLRVIVNGEVRYIMLASAQS